MGTYSKDDIREILKFFKFEKMETNRGSGSHIQYRAEAYQNIIITLVDHKNTKELAPKFINDITKKIILITYLDVLADKGVVNKRNVKKYLEKLRPKMMQDKILKEISTIIEQENNLINMLIPSSILDFAKSALKKESVGLMDIISLLLNNCSLQEVSQKNIIKGFTND